LLKVQSFLAYAETTIKATIKRCAETQRTVFFWRARPHCTFTLQATAAPTPHHGTVDGLAGYEPQ
jgi:hypothetical protein